MSSWEIDQYTNRHREAAKTIRDAFVIEEEPLPVKMKLKFIGREGTARLKFNQELIVPDFITKLKAKDAETNSSSHGRKLSALSEIDLEQDIFRFDFKLFSEQDPQELEYFLQLQDWQSTHLDMSINFTNPLTVSQGSFNDLA